MNHSLLNFINNTDKWYIAHDKETVCCGFHEVQMDQMKLYRVESCSCDNPVDHLGHFEIMLDMLQQLGTLLTQIVWTEKDKTQYIYGIVPDTQSEENMSEDQLMIACQIFEASFYGCFMERKIGERFWILFCGNFQCKEIHDYYRDWICFFLRNDVL